MKDEIKEILDYLKKEVNKFEESKTYLMETYNYREQDIENIEQHKKYVYFKKLLNYITNLQEGNKRLNNIIDELEKWLEDYIKLFNQPDMLEEQTLEDLKEVLDKLKELKEGKE